MTRGRVAFVYTSRTWRGSGVVFAEVAGALARQGHETVALVPAGRLTGAEFAKRGVPVREAAIGHTGFAEARAMHRALAEFGADVVFADRPRDIRLTAAASLVRPVAIVHCLSTPEPARDLLTRVAYRRVRLTVYLTEDLAARALALAPWMDRVPHRVIPNGVDLERFRPDPAAGEAFRTRHGLGAGALLVGVGALEPEKRWDLLIESVALVPGAPPLALCGEGQLRNALLARAAERRVDLRLLGVIPHDELAAACNAATVIVHSRPDEVFALSLLEALACGRPVLAAAGGGTPELLGDAGVLVPPRDPGLMARALTGLLGDAPRRAALGHAARRRVEQHFSRERMMKRWVETVGELV
ncbi:MAG TPA: glycosyltransferase family 4 protein [Gemmatimonadales bacterium]|nr:glycosyltransferase family 4 protein [Gemmatimonadales bacterium]